MEKVRTLCVALVAILLIISISEFVSLSEAQICDMTQDGLNSCKPSISGSNPAAKPSAWCCSALGKANLTCLCSYRNSPLLPYLGIDPRLAMQLPSKCKLTQVPDQC